MIEKIILFFLNKKNKEVIIKQYKEAAKNYNKKQLVYIFEYLKQYDLRSKGVNNKSTNQNELLKELVFKIIHS